MRVIHLPSQMRETAEALRSERPPLGLVPTMGALHEGHLSLIRRALDECGAVAVSIFVNPAQFAPSEDLDTYPRTFDADVEVCRENGVSAVYAPKATEMYGESYGTWVEVPRLAQGLCGSQRPGHFRGVATVVLKLFAACLPHRAYFGEKDYQQLVLIRRMTCDLDLGVEIVGCPIVRESDGLALSSRNACLEGEDRSRALALIRGLRRVQALVGEGRLESQCLIDAAREELERVCAEVDYVEVVHPATLEAMDVVDGPARMALAARVGGTRLIDNVSLEPPK